MQAPENGSQGTPGRQCAQFVDGRGSSVSQNKNIHINIFLPLILIPMFKKIVAGGGL